MTSTGTPLIESIYDTGDNERSKRSRIMATGVVCFGELLLRLGAPGRELLLQTPRLEVHCGGAEANVAVSLACFGHSASMVSVVPDNALGRASVGELRKHGVRTDAVRFGPGRMGLYFLSSGAVQRPSEVLYDRAGSAFAIAPPELIDWDVALAGSTWLHVSGITPAVSSAAAEAALRGVRAARSKSVAVSFDCNYRAKLWEAWDGAAGPTLRSLAAEADVLFAEDRVLALMLGAAFEGTSPEQRFAAAAERAFDAFEPLQRLVTTVRVQHSVDHHELSALMAMRGRVLRTGPRALPGIVDRIGTGDAFAAGILHGLTSSLDDAATLEFGLAAACIKHSIPGDYNLVGVRDVENVIAERGWDVKR
jgi:2-dehydro-3-deoxygluconokinase